MSDGTSYYRHGGEAVTYLDVLVPAVPDPRDLVERLRKVGIRDGGDRVELGPLDEATLNLLRRVVTMTCRNLWLELPRGRHDIAVMLGIYLQLMRLGARMQGHFGPESFSGPVVVVGLNVNLTARLRRIKIWHRVFIGGATGAAGTR